MMINCWKPRGLVAPLTRTAALSHGHGVDYRQTAGNDGRLCFRMVSRIPLLVVYLAMVMLLMAAGVTAAARPALAANPDPAAPAVVPGTPLTFDDSIRLAIRQSPFFTKSSLEIDIRRMDETDSRYGMVPPLTFQTYYYVTQPDGVNTKPYSLNFSTAPYNPFASYFTLQAQKLITEMAVYGHLKVISKGIQSLGQIFLQLDSLKKLEAYQKDLIALAQENLTYVQNRLSMGTATTLDLKVAQQNLQIHKGEQSTLEATQKRVLNNLKNLLGIPAAQVVNPDYRDSRRQVLGTFDPAATNLDQAKDRSYDLKIFDYQQKAQKYNIYLATARVFPTILFTAQNPNPLSVSTSQGLYVGFGLEIPVWDGFKRIRNISRQKATLKQLEGQREERVISLEDKWLESVADVQEKELTLKAVKSQEELVKLKAQQNEVRYQSGEIQLPVMLESRKEVLTTQKEVTRKVLEYERAVLNLREISGDLGHSYVDPTAFKK